MSNTELSPEFQEILEQHQAMALRAVKAESKLGLIECMVDEAIKNGSVNGFIADDIRDVLDGQ